MGNIRYLWWRSCYDGLLHAFPVAPGAALAHQHYRATCTHAAPPDLAGSAARAGDEHCSLCVLMTGGPPGIPAQRHRTVAKSP